MDRSFDVLKTSIEINNVWMHPCEVRLIFEQRHTLCLSRTPTAMGESEKMLESRGKFYRSDGSLDEVGVNSRRSLVSTVFALWLLERCFLLRQNDLDWERRSVYIQGIAVDCSVTTGRCISCDMLKENSMRTRSSERWRNKPWSQGKIRSFAPSS